MNYTTRPVLSKSGVFTGSAVLAVLLSGAAAFPVAHALDVTPFTQQMQIGSQGVEVSKLQTFLAADPAIYPQGLVTGHYGPLTANAVKQFQVTYSLPIVGRVGPLTLSAMNSVISSGLPLDVSAPIISVPAVGVDHVNVTISWDTNEAAHGAVFYSTSPLALTETSRSFTQPTISGTSQSTTGTPSVHQSVMLTGLARATTYFYVVEAIDASGNTTVTLPAVFTTGS